MEHFYDSFMLSLLHSLWQSALLFGFYYGVIFLFKTSHPLFRRNLLFGILTVQLCVTIISFCFYYTGAEAGVPGTLPAFLDNPVPFQRLFTDYSGIFFYSYNIIILAKTIFYLHRWLQFRNKLSQSLIKPSINTRLFTNTHALRFGIHKKITIRYSNHIHTPVTFGFLKPMILLPFTMVNQLSAAETEALIIHELTHIRQNDYLLNWYLIMLETIFFFNPCIMLLGKQVRLEREMICDRQVMDCKYDALEYAGSLLKLARHNIRLQPFQLAAAFKQPQLLQRIRYFTNEQHRKERYRPAFPLALTGFMLILMLHFFISAKPDNINDIVPAAAKVQAAISQNSAETAGPVISTQAVAAVKINTGSATTKPRNTIPKPNAITGFIALSNAPAASIETSAQEAYETMPGQLTPVSFSTAPDAEHSKEIIVNEESSNGTKLTKVYKLRLVNARWITEPLMVITEIHVHIKDSLQLKVKPDSIYLKRISVTPAFQ